MTFPEIDDKDFSINKEKNTDVKSILDYAVSQYDVRRTRRSKMEKLYNSYNGIIDSAVVDSVIKKTGKKSKTKYIKYRLGRSKVKQLHGEFLEIPIEASVRSVNRDAQNERMNKYKQMLGMSLAKPYIEKARSEGYNVFDGIQIPDKNDKEYWNINNFKLANEIVMNSLIDDKLQNNRLKIEFYQNFVDLTIVAEMFGKNERDVDGIDTYRYIPAKFALYEESVFDPFLDRTPYMGEVRNMYYHEILTNQEFNLTNDQKEQLKQTKEYPETDDNQGDATKENDHPSNSVYTLQWKGLETVYKKITPAKGSKVPYKRILSEEYYKKNREKIEFDIKKGKYTVEKYYREILWTASRINKDIYTSAKKEEYIIQRLNENGKFKVDFDYTGMLFSTVNGTRVSMQEIIYELEKVYDDIRFMINKEIRKVRGDTLAYDKAFLPKNKLISDVIYDISEDGVITYDSSAEGNRSGMESDSNKVGIQTLNLGQNQSMIILLGQAIDIERVMDRITGMNESRQGLEKATATATTNTNNVEASRSMTYDMFFFMREYEERVLMKLAEKTKLNEIYYGEDSRKFVLSDQDIQYLVSTKNIMQDNYAISVTDGRNEQKILGKMQEMFPLEINSGTVTTGDIGKFLIESNFAKAIKILDEARQRAEAVAIQQSKVSQESKQSETESKLKIATDNREDLQEHEKEMEVLRTEGKKEVEVLKGSFKATQDFQNNTAKLVEKQSENKEDIFNT